ncbi:hypothetical protein ISN45_Aa04g001750, partial [Arabidopsis thaliana x Arabidopsis arenosa]
VFMKLAHNFRYLRKCPTTFDIYEIVPKLSVFKKLPHNFRYLRN